MVIKVRRVIIIIITVRRVRRVIIVRIIIRRKIVGLAIATATLAFAQRLRTAAIPG